MGASLGETIRLGTSAKPYSTCSSGDMIFYKNRLFSLNIMKIDKNNLLLVN